MADDQRARIYDDLHHDQLVNERARNRASAVKILGILREYFQPRSMLDVGCGLGTWLGVARELGAQDVYGVDGEWVDDANLDVEPAVVSRRDLEQGFSLDRQFDLVISLEVAEHLHERAADGFVASLVRHGDVVLFSAAIPGQGGHHHVNEQFADYWAERFARHGYRPLDLIRPRIWNDAAVLWWLRQNLLVYANERALERYPALRAQASPPAMLSVVLPLVYMARAREASEYQGLMGVLSSGGKFKVTRSADGSITVEKVRGLLGRLTGG